MPKAEYVPPGFDPTQEEYEPRGPSCSGCLLIIGAVILFVGVVIVAITGTQAAAKGKATPTEAATIEPTIPPPPTSAATHTPAATWTPAIIVITATNGATRALTATPTQTMTPTHTPTVTVTPTFTGTPFPAGLWVSLSAIWPKRDGLTVSGVSWRAVVDRGLICPDSWPIGATVLLETQQEYLCVDRYKTARCKDSICTALLFTQAKVDPAPRKAIVMAGGKK